MKRINYLALTLLCVVVSLLTSNIYANSNYEAKKNMASVQIDKVSHNFEAYTIKNNNYFKLRDIAFVLNNTEKQFSVEWQKQNDAVILKSKQPYAPIGTEMSTSSIQTSQTAVPTKSKIIVNGQKIEATSYLINGNNFLKLQDLGKVLNFGVAWNDVTRTIQISSDKGYQLGTVDSPIQPWKYQEMLGKGLDVDWSGNRRGKQYYNVQAVKDFKAAGISHVRIRMIDDATEELLSGLDKQINDCLENGLVPVIAYHGGDFETNPTKENMQKAINWWKIVANRYKDYSHLLSFNLIIEVSDSLNKEPQILNQFYEQAVTEIRKSNPTRIIMISPRLRSDASYLNELKIPTMHNNYLMAEWHFYASGPSKNVERKIWTTGTDAEKKLIIDKINLALNWQKQTGIPTWVGAWMPGNYNEGNTYTINEQVVFSTFMAKSLTKANIPFAINSDTKFYNRETNQWVIEMKPVFQSIFGISNNVQDNKSLKPL